MVYSRMQEHLARWIWVTIMGIVAVPSTCETVRAVRDIFRLGLSAGTGNVFLLFAGIALISLSCAVSSLLIIMQSPSPSEKRPRWLLLALGIGVVMTVLGMIGIF